MIKLTQEQVLTIPKLLETLSVKEVADKLGVGYSAIYYWIPKFKEKGYNVKPARNKKKGIVIPTIHS